jgi:hypothetical protein
MLYPEFISNFTNRFIGTPLFMVPFYAVGPLFSAIASKIKIIRIKKPKNS